MKYVVFGTHRQMLEFSRNNHLKLGHEVILGRLRAVHGQNEPMIPVYFEHTSNREEVEAWIYIDILNTQLGVIGRSDYIPLGYLLSGWKDGDEIGWEEEFRFLTEHHEQRLTELAASIITSGITRPILLGNDGRVWDGHHRLCVAARLGMHFVPVEYA